MPSALRTHLFTARGSFKAWEWRHLRTWTLSLSRSCPKLTLFRTSVLLGSTITDLFFVHEHGVRIALWQVTYIAAVNLTPSESLVSLPAPDGS